MQFKDFGFNKSILKSIEEKGYQTPTQIQQQAIPVVLSGKDLIASAQTGTGKTAAFSLPILQSLFCKQDAPKKGKKIRALIVTPTRELAQQIEDSFKIYSKYTNLRTAAIYGGVSIKPQQEILNKGVDVLIATPGRLLDLHKQDMLFLDFVEIIVLDEADLMLDMGFIDDVKKINKLCVNKKQSLLFSATIPLKIKELSIELLHEPLEVFIAPSVITATTISQKVYYVPKPKKIELCLHLLRNTIKGSVIIFRRTKFGVEKLEQSLNKNGYLVSSIHGDKSQSLRLDAIEKFKNKEVHILIATDVASRGLDIPNVDSVINFDIPNISETYVHRIGRTGRAENLGIAYSFCGADEKKYIVEIRKLINISIEVVEDHPYPLDPKATPQIHKAKGSKYKKGRKSEASKKKKKRWY